MEDYKKTHYCTQVQVLRDGQVIKSLIFNQDKIVIGRILSVDLVIDDISISRIHAAIDVNESGAIQISDLGSINGIEIAGKKVTEAKILSGTSIKLGDIELIVDIFREEDVEESPMPRAPIIRYYSDLDDVVDLKKLAASRTMMVKPETGGAFSVKPGVSGIFTVPKERGNVLECVLLFNDSIMDVKHIEGARTLTIGPSTNNDIMFAARTLPSRYKVIHYAHGKYYLNFKEEMGGYVQKGSENVSLEKLKQDPRTQKREGRYLYPLGMKDIVKLEMGASSLLFLFVEKSEAIPRKKVIEPDPPYHTSLVLSFVLHLLLVLIIQHAKIPDRVRLEEIDDRFVNLIIKQKKPVFQQEFKKKIQKPKIVKTKPKPKEKIKPKPRKQAKIAKKVQKKKIIIRKPPKIVSIDDKKPTKKVLKKPKTTKLVSKTGQGTGDGLKRKRKGKNVKKIGVLGALNKGGSGSLSKLFGKRGIGKGRGKNIISPRGVRGGETSFGLKSVRSQGVGKTFGVGSGNVLGDAASGAAGVKTATGVLKGQAGISLKQFNRLKGSKYTGQTTMNDVNTVVIGSLRKDQIWAVVEKHFAEIQNCYEVALQGDSKLSGRIVMHWTINAQGRVSYVTVKKSTLKNVYTETCIKKRIKYWIFPRPRGGGIVKVSFPFVFKPL